MYPHYTLSSADTKTLLTVFRKLPRKKRNSGLSWNTNLFLNFIKIVFVYLDGDSKWMKDFFADSSSSTSTSALKHIAVTSASICSHPPELCQHFWPYDLTITFERGCRCSPNGPWCPCTTGVRKSRQTDLSGNCWFRILEIVRQRSSTGAWLSMERQQILNPVKYVRITLVVHLTTKSSIRYNWRVKSWVQIPSNVKS